jgi:hypothetical protein
MPVSEAVDEPSAKLKMSALIESAVRKAFLPPYQTKIVEYDDVSVLGKVLKRLLAAKPPHKDTEIYSLIPLALFLNYGKCTQR